MGMHDAWNKRLAKARQLHEERAVIWWSRLPFHDPKYKDKVPKWHIFADRKQDEETKYEYIWEAKCGYTHTFSEGLLMEYPKLNLSKKAPPKDQRCIKCLQQEIRKIK